MCSALYPKNQPKLTTDNFPLYRKVLLSLVRQLPAELKSTSKITRIAYGKTLKHMRYTGAQLHLKTQGSTKAIYWQGKLVTTTAPLPKFSQPGSHLWIMATGPSLKSLDLKQLQDKEIVGLNGAIVNCLENGLTPKYYVITDLDFFESRMKLVEKAIKSGAHCLFSFNGIARICAKSPELLRLGKISLLETVNRYFMTPQISEKELRSQLEDHPALILPKANDVKSGWSHDIQSGIFSGNTIAYIACQIANSLRYDQAYILGMDLGRSLDRADRSYETGPHARPTSLDQDYPKYILPAFTLLSHTTTHTKYWNISDSSRLPESVMPRISFSDALSNEF